MYLFLERVGFENKHITAIISKIAKFIGLNYTRIPLSYYINSDFNRLFQDSYDRFFTNIEHRFSKPKIEEYFKYSDCFIPRNLTKKNFFLGLTRKINTIIGTYSFLRFSGKL